MYDTKNSASAPQINLDVVRSVSRLATEDRGRDKLTALANELRKLSFFRQLPNQAVWDLARVVRYVKVPAGATSCEVFRQGDTGRTVYFIVAGQCEVRRRDMNVPLTTPGASGVAPSGKGRRMSLVSSSSINSAESGELKMLPNLTDEDRKEQFGDVLAMLRAPNSFGELAMLRTQRRTASVIARPETELLKVVSSDFERVVLRLGNVLFMPEQVRYNLSKPKDERTDVEITLVAELLKNLRFFQRLNLDVVKSLCRPLALHHLGVGEVCFHEGDVGDAFYIVLTGEVLLCKHKQPPGEDGKAVVAPGMTFGNAMGQYHETLGEVITVLQAGDTFGEKALLNAGENLRYTSAVASRNSELLVLNRKDFSRYMAGMEDVIFANEVAARLLKIPPEERTALQLEKLGELLKTNSFFKEQTPKLRREICRVAQFRSVPKESVVVRQGDAGDSFYVILRGTLSVHLSESAEHMAARMAAQQAEQRAAQRAKRSSLGNAAMALRRKSSGVAASEQRALVLSKGRMWKKNAESQSMAKKIESHIVSSHVTSTSASQHLSTGDEPAAKIQPPESPAPRSVGGRRRSVGGNNEALEPSELYGPCQAFLSGGQSFGELALLNGAPRAATVVTQEASELLVIMKSDYDKVMLEEQQRHQNSVLNALRSLPTIGSWDSYLVVKLSYIFKETTFPCHVVLLCQGDPAGNFFVIREGTCSVSIRRRESDNMLASARGITSNARSKFASAAVPPASGGFVATNAPQSPHPARLIHREGGGGGRISIHDLTSSRIHMPSGVKAVIKGGGAPVPTSEATGGASAARLEAMKFATPRAILQQQAPMELELCVLGSGECFGEYSVFNRAPQPATVTTSSAVTHLLTCTGEDIVQTITTLQTTNDILSRHRSASNSALDAMREHAANRMEFLKRREHSILQVWSDVGGGRVGEVPKSATKVGKLQPTTRSGESVVLPALVSPRLDSKPRRPIPNVPGGATPRRPAAAGSAGLEPAMSTPWLSELGQDQPGGFVQFWVSEDASTGHAATFDGIHGACRELILSPRSRAAEPEMVLQRRYHGEFISPNRRMRFKQRITIS